MRSRSVPFICLVFVFGLVACTPKPQLTKRYSSIVYDPASAGEVTLEMTISLFSINPPSPEQKPKTALDLSDRGQAEFIKLAGSKVKNADELRTAVFKPFKSPPSEEHDRSRTNLTRRLVFSLQKKSFRPADRIEEAVTTLLIGQGVKFVSWNQFENRYKTIKPGSIELEQTNTTKVETSLSFPQVQELGDIALSQEFARRLKESENLEKDIVQFSAQLEDNRATLFQKGATSIDLSGTFIVDVELAFQQGSYDQVNVIKFKNLFDESGNPVASSKISSATTKVSYPYSSCAITTAALETIYQIRRVVEGESTHQESDDKVLMTVKTTKTVLPSVLIPATALELNFWYITAPDGRQLKWQSVVGNGVEAITFTSFDDALAFLQWLKRVPQKPTYLNQRRIGIEGAPLEPLTSANVDDLTITLETANPCEQETGNLQ